MCGAVARCLYVMRNQPHQGHSCTRFTATFWTSKRPATARNTPWGGSYHPTKLDEASEGYDHQTRQRVRGHWFLCGDCSQEMFDGIARHGEAALRYSLGVSQRGDDIKFLVVNHQLGNAQHRFLVPMWDPRVPNLVEALSQGQTSISLARKGDTQAVVLSLTADAPYALELRKHLDMFMPDPQRLQALLRATPEWMETAAEPEQFPNLIEGLAITDVSVSIVFDAMLPNLSQLLAKKLGPMGPPCTEKKPSSRYTTVRSIEIVRCAHRIRTQAMMVYGNLATQPLKKISKSTNKAYFEFRIAESQRRQDSQPTWYTCRVMKETMPELTKGDFVKVTGKLKADFYL